MFEQTRSKVLSIIEQNKVNEVTRDTSAHKAGVYMLFVNCFEDDIIIPFYIGQTNDFQERYKQHFSEIMSLNRLNRECYEYALFAELYNGHARPCKIFSYMVNHDCSLKDFHMIVLETIEDENVRKKAEQRYIDDLYAPFFGFNQLNSVLCFIETSCYGGGDKKEYDRAKEQDIEKILRFPMLGYGAYNWYRSCESFYETMALQKRTNEIPDVFLKILESKKRLEEINLRLSEIKRYNGWRAEDEAWDICKETIRAYFTKRNLKSEDKKKLVVKILLFDFEDDRKQLEKYFAKYSNKIDEDIFESINHIHGKEIQSIKQQVINNQDEYCALEDEQKVLNNIVLGTLLPKYYVSHPLGDMEKSITFAIDSDEENVCYLNVEVTCFKNDYNNDYYPDIVRVDYCVVNKGQSIARTIYTDNCLTDFFNCDNVYYCERGGKYGPFNPYLVGGMDTHIPVAMEYKNGINEWTLRDKETEDFRKVFKEINCLIDKKTKIIYSTSGYKSTILRFATLEDLSDTVLMKKLKRLLK